MIKIKEELKNKGAMRSNLKLKEGGHKSKSAARLMTDNIPVLFADEDIARALKLLKKKHFESINYLYIVDHENILLGAVSIKEIFRQAKETLLGSLIVDKLISVRLTTKAEAVANLALKYNIKSVPVIDAKGKLLGVVLSDAILEIAYYELQDDLSRLAGLNSLENSYAANPSSILASLKNRLPWLIVGLFGGFLISKIISSFENMLAVNVILAAFIPLIVYMASAVQTQIGFFIVRDLAFNPNINFLLYAWRQFRVVTVMGLSISVLVLMFTFIFYQDWLIAYILALAMFLAILSSIITGVLIPFIFQRLKFDPASASGPIATIIQDLVSIAIYLLVAQTLL